jgi:hypothetical protein
MHTFLHPTITYIAHVIAIFFVDYIPFDKILIFQKKFQCKIGGRIYSNKKTQSIDDIAKTNYKKLIIHMKDLCLPKQVLTCAKHVYC